MSVAPIRALAEHGLGLDTPTFELPPNGFSNGSNVRFKDGAVRRSSVLRQARHYADPLSVLAVGFTESSGYDRLFTAASDGSIQEIFEDSTLAPRNPSGFAPASSNDPWTWDVSGDVLYLNKPTHAPVYLSTGASAFAPLPEWPADHRARALAASRDQLFAVGITKGSVPFPNTVKISDYSLYSQPPTTWDPLAVGGVANEITIAGARSPLVGCLDLDGTMIVYGERQAWRFVFTGDTSNSAQNLWINEPLFVDRGLIATNAVAYMARKHYVFGTDDLYVHDGVTSDGLADAKVRRWVFKNLDVSKAYRCFVAVDPGSNEVIFAFPSNDADAAFGKVRGCNRGAVFNTNNGTWSLIDLPDVTGAGYANFNPTAIWSDAAGSWLSFGGSWADLSDGYARSVMFPCVIDGAARLLALDAANTGRVSFEAVAELNPTAFVERLGYDLDELGAGLSTYKIVSTLLPQVTVPVSDVPVRFRVGVSRFPQGPYDWSPWRTFDPATDYKVDYRKGGRYLGLRMEMNQPVDFELAGLDVDLRTGGRR